MTEGLCVSEGLVVCMRPTSLPPHPESKSEVTASSNETKEETEQKADGKWSDCCYKSPCSPPHILITTDHLDTLNLEATPIPVTCPSSSDTPWVKSQNSPVGVTFAHVQRNQ